MSYTAQNIQDFWYSDWVRAQWFRAQPSLDVLIRTCYQRLWEEGCAGLLDDWQHHASGSLSLAIVLDQFPLNMFRGQAKAFVSLDKAIAVSHHAIKLGFHHQLPQSRVAFLIMPLMHSENMADQDQSLGLFGDLGLADNLHFAKHHHGVVKRFGRFPHRNAILGRDSTTEEIDYLASKAAFGG